VWLAKVRYPRTIPTFEQPIRATPTRHTIALDHDNTTPTPRQGQSRGKTRNAATQHNHVRPISHTCHADIMSRHEFSHNRVRRRCSGQRQLELEGAGSPDN
jgi:hypothetical protein